jgi:DNA repair ATPase RecN
MSGHVSSSSIPGAAPRLSDVTEQYLTLFDNAKDLLSRQEKSIDDHRKYKVSAEQIGAAVDRIDLQLPNLQPASQDVHSARRNLEAVEVH